MGDDSGRVTILGAGSWGTALAIHMARRGHTTRLWARSTEHAAAMRAEGRNARYLPEVPFSQTHSLSQGAAQTDSLSSPAKRLWVTANAAEALEGTDLVICAIPSHAMRETMRRMTPILAARDPTLPPPLYLIAAKGIEVETLANMHDVLHEELPPGHRDRVAVLGGPSFAAEVAIGLPTTVVVASQHEPVRLAIQRMMSGEGIRAYVTDDVIGVELGGVLKNVIALAAGIGDGAGLGQNARAGLITRGLAEISRIAIKLGAHPATLSGLAGLGDLVLTCTGGLSRNRRVGIALGQGRSLEEILTEMGMVAEGVKNTMSAYKLAQREGVEMPLVSTMHAILYGGLAVRDAVDALMGRALRAEREW